MGNCQRHERGSARAAARFAVAIAVAGAFAGAPVRAGDEAPAPATCAKAEFEAVVDEAAAALRDLNSKNRPEFQDRLRQLKDKRGWSNDDFLKAAAPFVKDEQIEVFDSRSNELLTEISTMGQEGSAASTPDCSVLEKLREHMKVLVATQTSKWSYMFQKLDTELSK